MSSIEAAWQSVVQLISQKDRYQCTYVNISVDGMTTTWGGFTHSPKHFDADEFKVKVAEATQALTH